METESLNLIGLLRILTYKEAILYDTITFTNCILFTGQNVHGSITMKGSFRLFSPKLFINVEEIDTHRVYDLLFIALRFSGRAGTNSPYIMAFLKIL